MEKENTVGTIIKLIGIATIVIGFLAALVIGSELGKLGLLDAIYIFLVTFISGMTFIGFAEIIKLLHKINSKLDDNKQTKEKKETELDSKESDRNKIKWKARPQDKVQIEEMFKRNNENVEEIIPTPEWLVYAVKINGRFDKLVDTGGFKPVVLDIEKRPEIKEWIKNNIN